MTKMDEIFRKQLQHRTEEVPTHLWEGIESKLGVAAGKRRLVPLYMAVLGGILLMGIVVGSYLFLTMDNTSGIMADGSVLDLTSSTRSNAEEDVMAVADANDAASSTDRERHTSTVIATSVEAKQLSDDSYEQADIGNLSSGSPQRQAVGSFDDYEEVADLTARESEMEESDSVTKENERILENAGQLNSETQIKTQEAVIGIAAPASDIQWVIERSDNVTVNTISAPKIMKSEAFNRRRELYRAPADIASIIDYQPLLIEEARLADIRAAIPLMYTECPTFSTDHTGVFLDVYMGHVMPSSTLSAKESGSLGLEQLRSDSETSEYSIGFGGRVSLRMPSGFSLRTGIDYLQLREQVRYTAGGDDVQTSTNKYQFFDLPLLLGYEFGAEGSRLYYGANAGVMINATFGQSGRVLDVFGTAVDIDDAGPEGRSAFEDTAGISYYVSGAIYYRLLDGADIYVEPYARVIPNDLSAADYLLEQRFNMIGLNTGLRFRF